MVTYFIPIQKTVKYLLILFNRETCCFKFPWLSLEKSLLLFHNNFFAKSVSEYCITSWHIVWPFSFLTFISTQIHTNSAYLLYNNYIRIPQLHGNYASVYPCDPPVRDGDIIQVSASGFASACRGAVGDRNCSSRGAIVACMGGLQRLCWCFRGWFPNDEGFHCELFSLEFNEMWFGPGGHIIMTFGIATVVEARTKLK